MDRRYAPYTWNIAVNVSFITSKLWKLIRQLLKLNKLKFNVRKVGRPVPFEVKPTVSKSFLWPIIKLA